METDTRDKLREASFFLEQMEGSADNPTSFSYNLSAFISAARSVTMIMDVEFSKVPGYKEWKASKAEAVRQGIFRYFNEQRRRLVHLKPLTNPEFGILHRNIEDGRTLVVFTISGTAGTNVMASVPQNVIERRMKQVLGDYDYFFEDVADKSVHELCDEYRKELSKLVLEVESRFAK